MACDCSVTCTAAHCNSAVALAVSQQLGSESGLWLEQHRRRVCPEWGVVLHEAVPPLAVLRVVAVKFLHWRGTIFLFEVGK